ncbi:MAG TPA: DUF29 domain-containing protein [Geminicoccaceae bacterium]|nr:DUF29 domain-containing protein [Geminicoccaceae bacterium]
MSTILHPPASYEGDFYLWTRRQAAELRRAARAGSNLPLDWENLAEEIESLGVRDRREIASRIEQIALHLLKLQFSPADDPRRGWQETVDRERSETADTLDQSPSLRHEIEPAVSRRWPSARRRAVHALAGEVEEQSLPRACPYTAEQILDPCWWPERTAP